MKKQFLRKAFLTAIKRTFYCLMILSSCFFGSFGFAEGSESSNSQEKQPDNDVGFAVEPIQTATQIDAKKGFYFIKVVSGEKQELTLKIRSTNEKPATVKIYVKNAYTNQNGAIDYDSEDYQRDPTLNDSIEEITTVSEKEVTVQNYEEKTVTLTVTPPKDSFTGVKGGTICVMNAKTSKVDEGLRSTFGYRIGLLVTEDSETYDDGATLELLNVFPTVHQGKRVIQARMQNPESKVLKDLTIETKLYKKGQKELLKKRTITNMRMAPNSQFDFATNWGIDPIKNGDYLLRVRATSGTNTWTWEEAFSVGDKQAKQMNEEASFTLTYPRWVPLAVLLLGITSIGLIGCLYVRSKKWHTEE